MKRSKKYLFVSQMIDFKKMYSFSDAIDLMKKTKIVNFDATVECNFYLKLDPKKTEQNLRNYLILPHGTGKQLKIVVIAKGLKLKEAEEAGADYVGDHELVDKITKKNFYFDILVVTPEMMPIISKLGRFLGPKGLMPSPKLGTVTDNIALTVKNIKKGRIEYKVDKHGNIHTIIGKISFSKEKLMDNLKFIYEHLIFSKPKTIKGNFFRSMTISSTMAPGIKIDLLSLVNKI